MQTKALSCTKASFHPSLYEVVLPYFHAFDIIKFNCLTQATNKLFNTKKAEVVKHAFSSLKTLAVDSFKPYLAPFKDEQLFLVDESNKHVSRRMLHSDFKRLLSLVTNLEELTVDMAQMMHFEDLSEWFPVGFNVKVLKIDMRHPFFYNVTEDDYRLQKKDLLNRKVCDRVSLLWDD